LTTIHRSTGGTTRRAVVAQVNCGELLKDLAVSPATRLMATRPVASVLDDLELAVVAGHVRR
jgi:hypothetical protein